MQPSELKAMRKAAGLTQGALANAIGLSQGFIGEMERGEKPIEKRTKELIEAQLRHRIDVSWSPALGKWTVSMTGPGGSGGVPSRIHRVINAYNDIDNAMDLGKRIKAEQFPFALLRITSADSSFPTPCKRSKSASELGLF